ncbi:MAG: tRNA (N(6)-L-threonylcarbamoyladenosine(37)-C(2))-methylthiotransferase MtaB [Candidatus Cloacimonadaceae bacterium]|nr:tRNA (N(6)-L-threonylcarbamoyladenosine(37)-C(2))-methylthiotransferase MtaB [Candidatus Cloacimonadota bacterium]MDY0112350.1 tRNA (N(6)-L-threonylcarbamoyladenosine(37)-C(2))-methylthiotransferase MtaB [Candidatus Syntrophosphaera sp.]
MIRIAIATLGCKTNLAESAIILSQFNPENYTLVPFASEADIYIINTCTVTNRTDYKSRNLIRKALKQKSQNPTVKVIVTGCYAQRNFDEISKLGNIDLIVDNQNKLDLAELLNKEDYHFQDIMQAAEFNFKPVLKMIEHTRAFQKIQDGCDFRCYYCAVPYARGPARSAKFSEVLTQAKLFIENGYKEIVLSGINLGLYEDEGKNLADIVQALEELEGLELIRLSSIEPHLFSLELIKRLRQCTKLCPHFHIPLQSGCDRTLKNMGRPYGTGEFQTLIDNILNYFPDAAIGLDVITGFPGETSSDFQITFDFIDKLPVAYLHIFPFSRRPGTVAFNFSEQILRQEKNLRVHQLLQLGKQKKEIYKQKLIQEKIILQGILESSENGIGTFLSDHYIRAYTSTKEKAGELIKIIPQQLYKEGVLDIKAE